MIVDGRPHLRAEARVFESADEREGDGEGRADQEEPVGADGDAHEPNRATQIGRRLDGLGGGAVDVGRRRHRDEDDPDGQETLVEVARAVEAAIE